MGSCRPGLVMSLSPHFRTQKIIVEEQSRMWRYPSFGSLPGPPFVQPLLVRATSSWCENLTESFLV